MKLPGLRLVQKLTTTLKCYKAPSCKAGLKQALAFPTKFSFCIQQGNIAFQNDISQKTMRLEVLS